MEERCAKQDRFNTTDNASSDVLFNRFLSEGQTPKQALQQWLQTFQFGHFITIEPTPSSPMKDDDMNQRLRQIDCQQNRKFIGNKYRKFSNQDRFWMVWFFEDGHKGREARHLHLLTYFPYHQMNIGGSENYKRNMVKNYVLQLWYSTPYFNYLNDARPVCPIHIETISTKKDSDRVAWYSTKKLHKDLANDDYIFFSYY
jgi:hypothetical protein